MAAQQFRQHPDMARPPITSISSNIAVGYFIGVVGGFLFMSDAERAAVRQFLRCLLACGKNETDSIRRHDYYELGPQAYISDEVKLSFP